MDTFPVTHSLLSTAALERIIDVNYGLDTRNSLQLIQSGLNDNYRFTSLGSPYFLRVYRQGWRTDDAVSWEIQLAKHLQEWGAPIAAPVQPRDLKHFVAVNAPEGRRQIAVFHSAPGLYTHFGNAGSHRVLVESCAEEFGKSMAEIHEAADSFTTEHERFQLDFSHLVVEPINAILHAYPHSEMEVKRIELVYLTLCDRLSEQLDGADWGACHADMTGGNSTLDQGRVFHFDFDCAGMGWRLYDMGVFYWSLTLNGHGDNVWMPFIKGYRAVRMFNDEDFCVVVGFAAIRALWLFGLWCANAERFGYGALHSDRFAKELEQFDRRCSQALGLLKNRGV